MSDPSSAAGGEKPTDATSSTGAGTKGSNAKKGAASGADDMPDPHIGNTFFVETVIPTVPQPVDRFTFTDADTLKHAQFCALVGITKPTKSKDSTGVDYDLWTRTLYAKVKKALKVHGRLYWFCAVVANALLLLQIVIGALVTALGATKNSYASITALGAINTVVAGLLTYFKSRGQPMRAQAFEEELRRCLDEIAQTESRFQGAAHKVPGFAGLDVEQEVARLWNMYEVAYANSVRNSPDIWVRAGEGPGTQAAKDLESGNTPTGTVKMTPSSATKTSSTGGVKS